MHPRVTVLAAREDGCFAPTEVVVREIREVALYPADRPGLDLGLVALFDGRTYTVRNCQGLMSQLRTLFADEEVARG